ANGQPAKLCATSLLASTAFAAVPCRPSSTESRRPHRLDRVEGDLCPAQVVVAHRPAAVAGAAEGEDHAGAPGGYGACGGARGDERCSRRGLHRRPESSTSISWNGTPYVYGWVIRLKEMSMLPAFATTASAWRSTASSSSASTTAVSASPPALRVSSATCAS